MRKALIFIAGTVAGAVALPATVLYVKPIRTKIVDGALNKTKRYVAAKIVDDAKFRKEMIEVGSEVLAGLILIEESQKEAK